MLTLRPYQVDDVAFMTEHKKVINANDMGLGKTAESAIAAQNFITHEHPLLVVSSLGQKWFWRDEIVKWTKIPEEEIEILTSPTLSYNKEEKQYKLVYIMHWDVLSRWGGLTKIPWGALIVDEAHKQKNRKAQRTKALWKLSKGIPVIYLLTGTPIVNQPDDLWSLLKTLYPKEYTSYWRFFKQYTLSEENIWGGYEILGVRDAEGLVDELSDKAFRRLKKDHLKDLPDKQHETVIIELSPVELKAYKEMSDYMITEVEGEIVKTPSLMGQEMKLREFCIGIVNPETGVCVKSTKLDYVMDVLQERHAAGRKTVIATMRRWPIHELERRLDKAKIKHTAIHGDVADLDRNEAVKQFQEDPETEVFIMTIQVGGEGWTLTAADMLIFLDRPWTPKDVLQTEDRLHRMTQKNAVEIITLLAKGTVEENVEKVLARKEQTIEAVMSRLKEVL